MIPFKIQTANWPTDANETWWQNGDNDDDVDDKEEEQEEEKENDDDDDVDGAVGASNDDDDDDYSGDGVDVDLGCVSLLKSMMQVKNPDNYDFSLRSPGSKLKGIIFHSFPFRRYPGLKE